MSDDEVIYVLPPAGQTPDNQKPMLGADKEQKYKTAFSSFSLSMRISFWFSLIVSIVCMTITTVILFISKSLSLERKLFLGGIVELILVSLQLMLCITRNEHRSLMIFTTLLGVFSGLGLGMAIKIE